MVREMVTRTSACRWRGRLTARSQPSGGARRLLGRFGLADERLRLGRLHLLVLLGFADLAATLVLRHRVSRSSAGMRGYGVRVGQMQPRVSAFARVALQ